MKLVVAAATKGIALGVLAGAITHALGDEVFGYVLFPIVSSIGFYISSIARHTQ